MEALVVALLVVDVTRDKPVRGVFVDRAVDVEAGGIGVVLSGLSIDAAKIMRFSVPPGLPLGASKASGPRTNSMRS